MNSRNNAIDAKRLIGRRISRPYYQSGGMNLRLFKVISGAGERPVVQIQYAGDEKQFSFEEIAAMLWTSYKQHKEAARVTIGDHVVVLDDFVNDSQRQATLNTANSAQINVVRIVNNPVCAALWYMLDKKALNNGKRNVLVYNHGGDALDVSLLTIDEEGVFCMRAIARDTHLGGDEFTNRLVNYFAADFSRKHKKDLTTATPGNSLPRLRAACESAKIVLSRKTQTAIQIDSLYDGIDFDASITRAGFNELNMELFLKSKETIDKCLIDAKITDKNQVHDVVLVGGSSNIPKLQDLLQDFFNGKTLCGDIDPCLVIMLGNYDYREAVGRSIKENRGRNTERVVRMQFLDFTRMNIGIETGDGLMTVLIPKNSTVPTKKQRILSTYSDNQSTMLIHVYHGLRPMAKNNSGVFSYILSGIPPAPRGVPRFKLCIDIDVDGTLSVLLDERVIFSMTNYCHFMMTNMVEPAEMHKTEDEAVKKKVEAKNALLNYAYDMRTTTVRDENVPSSDNKQHKIDEVIEWLKRNQDLAEVDVYEDKLKELEDLCNPVISTGAAGGDLLVGGAADVAVGGGAGVAVGDGVDVAVATEALEGHEIEEVKRRRFC